MKPDILSIERTGDTSAIVRLALPAAHPAFAGHFPGRPILPGVVQLDWAVRLASICFGGPFRPARRVRVKFMAIIAPGAELSVVLQHDLARATVAFEYRIGAAVASSGTAWLGA
jgi:3-hydroxymyristoyl/3-hydroxydecanoyl-(acyl carrier protein) dehydratase